MEKLVIKSFTRVEPKQIKPCNYFHGQIMNKFNWIKTGNHNSKANVTNSQVEFHKRTKNI